jgi:hypothetical protein
MIVKYVGQMDTDFLKIQRVSPDFIGVNNMSEDNKAKTWKDMYGVIHILNSEEKEEEEEKDR